MKVCFFLQRRFAYIGHALAYHLEKNHGVNEVCAYVQVRSNYEFLKNQRDLAYSGLILDENIHKSAFKEKVNFAFLRKLEADYGLPNLWPYLYLDRVLMNGQLVREYPHNKPLVSFPDILRLVQGTAKAVINFLDKEKPDVLVISVIGSLGASLLYHIAKKCGIKTINIDLTRIENRVAFSEDYKTFTFADEIFKNLEKGASSDFALKAAAFIKEFREKPTPYWKELQPSFNNQVSKSANLQFLKPNKFFKSFFWHATQLLKDILKKESDYTDIKMWWQIFDKIKRKIRGVRGYDDLWEETRENEDFAFYPLHVEPEIAIMLYAPLYTNQLELIRQAARALPVGMFLYVKEHPVMVGYRSRSFYKEIKNIPNVRLLKPSYYGPDIVSKAKIIITITSTSGWEGALFGKPVITFGDVFYNQLPNVKKCSDFEKLAPLVKDLLQNNRHNEKTLQNYISALMEDSVPVDYIDLWTKAESNEKIMNNSGIKEMARALAAKIKKRPSIVELTIKNVNAK